MARNAKQPEAIQEKKEKKKKKVRVFVNKVDLSLSADNAVLSLGFGGPDDLTAMMPTDQVDKMLSALWKWRSKMEPPHPSNPIGQNVEMILDPKWYTEPDKNRRGSLIHILHPGFGWLSFFIPLDEASKLTNYLLKQCEAFGSE